MLFRCTARTHGGLPIDVSDWTDRQVVLSCWTSTRYGQETGDTHFDNVPQRVREIWLDSKDHYTDEDWARLRAEFEQFGWGER